MSDQDHVKVFISWSGPLSKDVAVALRRWLPLLFDRIAPWVSETDIGAGQRGLSQIEAELADTRFGIVVLTSANQHAPWLNFEAGALSKTIASDVEHRVVPLLVDIAGPAQLTGPLTQFQAKTATADGMLALVHALAAVGGVTESVVSTRFQLHWPGWEETLEKARSTHANLEPAAQQSRRDEVDVLDEILLHVRAIRGARETNELHNGEALAIRGQVEQAAAENSLEVQRFLDGGHPGRGQVTAWPRGQYSATDANNFTETVRSFAPELTVTVVPF